MKTLIKISVTTFALVLLIPPSIWADPNAFPSSGLDAQSLGRGGTVIACPPGTWSSFGNPATLTPEGYYILAIDHLDQRDVSTPGLGLSIVDTSSSIRGAVTYFKDPEFASFTNAMWGASFSQTLMPSLFLGESFHMADYEPDAFPGSEKSLNTFDAGLLYKLGENVSIGYVAHNLLPSDRGLLEQYSGFGIGLQFPMTIFLAADYEEVPGSTGDRNLRTGLEFQPFERFTGRLGYQDLSNGETYVSYVSMGITYTDANGTLDAAIVYDNENENTVRVAFGLSMRM